MTTNLPPEAHVVRYVSYARTRRDAEERVLGILGDAFRRGPSEDGLSVTWIEWFPGEWEYQKRAAIGAIRNTVTCGKKSAFAWAKVKSIHDACSARGSKVRIIHAPEEGNPGHSEIRQLPREDEILLDVLASEVFSEWALNKDIV